MNALYYVCAFLLFLILLITVGFFVLFHELRAYREAFTLWRNRAFRLRARLYSMGGNWSFDPVPGDVKDVP